MPLSRSTSAWISSRQGDGQVFRTLRTDKAFEPRELDLEYLAIEKEQRVQRLVLRRRGDAIANRESRQERRRLGGAHLRRMSFPVKEDVALDPVDVGLLGAAAVVRARMRLRTRSRSLGLGVLGGVPSRNRSGTT